MGSSTSNDKKRRWIASFAGRNARNKRKDKGKKPGLLNSLEITNYICSGFFMNFISRNLSL